jgi:ribosomal protein S4E
MPVARPARFREQSDMAQKTIQAATAQVDGKPRRGVRRTVTILAVVALAVYLSTFLQVLMMK